MTGSGRGDRVDYLDWLRVLALAGVFGYHALHPFDTADWHVKNAEQSEALGVLLGILGSWGLAFFFLVAGAGTQLALRRRTAPEFVRERLTRLLIPLLAAYVLLTPPQYLIENRNQPPGGGSTAETVQLFFSQVVGEPPLVLNHTYHLWFVVFLLEFSLLGLPIFGWLRGPRGARLVTWLGDHAGHRGAVLLLALPLVPIHLAARGSPGEDHGWGEFVFYFDFFVLGHLLMTDARLTRAVRRDLLPALGLGLSGMVLLLVTGAPEWFGSWLDQPSYSWAYAWFFALLTLQAWGWILGALSLGMRATAFRRPLPRTIGAAAMPFFLVHQPVILAIAAVVVSWDLSIPAKILVLTPTAFAASAAMAWAISRLPGVSVLFGVKRRGQPLPRPQTTA